MSQKDAKDAPPAVSSATSESVAAPTREGEREGEIEELRRQLQEKEEEARANHDRFVRDRAELENFKKRMQREKSEALRFASEPLIRELLPVVDNLERALEHGEGNGQSVREGVRLVLQSLIDILQRHGVKRIEAVGAPFDPAQHEAMTTVESDEYKPNHVVAQHHVGYQLHDRLLRPALVTVSGRRSDAVESEENSG